ncbi:MAG: zinc-dependent metalloprotease [Microthrixaceae bacterium]|jgi:coenzyme F420 biosynthesis associated uncharacterized protein|nr:zinc-dependent metalloprotease [Actinomycetota bacterium]HMS13503.1 zinc-dependent metalloprotease [Microthrixaceae bacterium]HMT23679.1 zinc-dependent metalloprotease [Microthrixaceae bacterium]HMT61362.1 zinc-dependent metalloprotease [Microthrixaceae bacterium]
MPSAVDWRAAEAVAVRLARREPIASSFHYRSLADDFTELTATAQGLVEAHTGWNSLSGDARARVVDRADWIRANLASFRRLLRPLTDRMEDRMVPGPVTAMGAAVAGAQLGAMLGWMSTRVLGQYDLLVLEDEDTDDQDIVYYVGPNILALEKRFTFPPQEFRLWVALHEVTHRTQFTAKPWLRTFFLDQVQGLMQMAEPDPRRLFDAIGRVAEGLRTGKNPLDDGGLMALFASTEQRATMDRVGGLMSLLEGHGDVTMDRAGGSEIPSAERFGRVLRQRRAERSGAAALVQKLMGLDAKLAQYDQGERFIAAIEAAGGPTMLDRAFAGPDDLPTLAEIRDPEAWLGRVAPTAGAARPRR